MVRVCSSTTRTKRGLKPDFRQSRVPVSGTRFFRVHKWTSGGGVLARESIGRQAVNMWWNRRMQAMEIRRYAIANRFRQKSGGGL